MKLLKSLPYLVIAILIVLVGILFTIPESSPVAKSKVTDVGKVTATNPYPTPSKKLANFYHLYTSGAVQYDISPITTNMTEDTIHGASTFTVDFYNSSKQDFTLNSQSTDIGCVAKVQGDQYTTVKDDPSIFTLKAFTNTPNTGQGIVLKSWEHKKINIDVHPTCKYIGTADLEYYWVVK